jgi:hypothetical protein
VNIEVYKSACLSLNVKPSFSIGPEMEIRNDVASAELPRVIQKNGYTARLYSAIQPDGRARYRIFGAGQHTKLRTITVRTEAEVVTVLDKMPVWRPVNTPEPAPGPEPTPAPEPAPAPVRSAKALAVTTLLKPTGVPEGVLTFATLARTVRAVSMKDLLTMIQLRMREESITEVDITTEKVTVKRVVIEEY